MPPIHSEVKLFDYLRTSPNSDYPYLNFFLIFSSKLSWMGTLLEYKIPNLCGVKSLKIQTGAIHNVDGTWLWNQMITYINIVNLFIGDPNERRNVTAQVQLGSNFTVAFVFRKGAHGKVERHRSIVDESKA